MNNRLQWANFISYGSAGGLAIVLIVFTRGKGSFFIEEIGGNHLCVCEDVGVPIVR